MPHPHTNPPRGGGIYLDTRGMCVTVQTDRSVWVMLTARHRDWMSGSAQIDGSVWVMLAVKHPHRRTFSRVNFENEL